MVKPFSTEIEPETAIIVGVILHDQTELQEQEYLDELAFLAETAGIVVKKSFSQKLPQTITRTFIGTGKIEEINMYLKDNETDIVIFDDELSPTQLRNLEKELNHPIVDRTKLILDIFAQRAQTAYAKTQVEMARLQYMLPRLSRLWTHLDRERGGGTTSRRMGESQIEVER